MAESLSDGLIVTKYAGGPKNIIIESILGKAAARSIALHGTRDPESFINVAMR